MEVFNDILYNLKVGREGGEKKGISKKTGKRKVECGEKRVDEF